MADSDVTTGELGRRVDRLETGMQTGFAALADQLRSLQFVPIGVYTSDRSGDMERINRLEADLRSEREAREESEKVASQRAWQSRWSLITAAVGVPLAVVASVGASLLTAHLSP